MFSLEPTRYANTLGKVDLTKWTWNKLAVFLLVLTHLSPYYPNSDAGHSIECKLTPATRSPSSLKCFCTLWPMTLTFDFWPNIKWVDRTDDVASLVVVASAVFVLSCGQTNSYTNRRGRGLSLAWVTNRCYKFCTQLTRPLKRREMQIYGRIWLSVTNMFR